VHPDEDVLERRHLLEEADVLERPSDPELGDRVRRLPADVDAVEHDLAGRLPVDAGEHVEERRLPRAVRADQAHDRAGRNREVDVVDGDETAELLANAACDEKVCHQCCVP
jgi:hypothetical protein